MAVSISVEITAAAALPPILFLDEEPVLSDFTPAAKKVLNRILHGMIGATTLLANGAPVNSTSRVLQKMVELVAAGE